MGDEVRKRDERTQGNINNPGAEMRVKYDYTVILGVRVSGGKRIVAALRFGKS